MFPPPVAAAVIIVTIPGCADPRRWGGGGEAREKDPRMRKLMAKFQGMLDTLPVER